MIIAQTRPATDLAEVDRQLKDIYAALNNRLNADNINLKHKDTLERTEDDHHLRFHRTSHEISGDDIVNIDGGSF